MTKRMIIMLIAAAVVLGGVFGFEAFRAHMIKKFMGGMANMPQTVSTAKAEYQEWQPHFEAVGTLRAAKGVEISSELAGIVETIHFDSGDDVKAGAPLVSLRAEDDIAKLHSLQAAANLARINYERDKKQLAVQAVAQAMVDTDAANLKSAEAQVAEQQAIIDKKNIRAPFAGHLGIRQVDLGQYINPGTPIVTLQQLDPIYLDFTLPQQALSRIRVGQKVIVRSDAYPGREFNGALLAIDPKVDPATRNISLRASLENPDHALLPGMYATAMLETGQPERFITLPQTAITYNPYGNTVFLVEQNGKDEKGNPKLTAKQTFVTTGDTRGDQVAVLKGVSEGETVVTNGQIKLQNGTPLVINNTVQPTDNPHPVPNQEQ